MRKRHPFVAVLVLLAILFVGYRGYLSWRIHVVYQRARAAGFPVTREELNVWYATPTGTNAADVVQSVASKLDELRDNAEESADPHTYYQKALDELTSKTPQKTSDKDFFKRVETRAGELMAQAGVTGEKRRDVWDIDIPLSKEPLPEDIRLLLEKVVAPARPLLEKLFSIKPEDRARYTIDFTAWPDSTTQLLDSALAVQHSCEYLNWDAVLKANAGDGAGAATSVSAAFRVAATLAEEPTVLSQMTRVGALQGALDALAQMATRVQFDQASLDLIRNSLAHADPPDAIVRGYAGERCSTRDHFKIESDRTQPLVPGFNEIKPSYWSWRLVYEIPYKIAGLEQWDEMNFNAYVDQVIEISKLQRSERLEGNKRFQHFAESQDAFMGIGLSPFPFLGSYANALLDVEAYRLHHGELPKQTEQLAQEPGLNWPGDPFSDKSLQYCPLDVGYNIRGAAQDSPISSTGASKLGSRPHAGKGVVVLR